MIVRPQSDDWRESVPSFIASYDLEDTRPSPYAAFLAAAENRGWSCWIKGGDSKQWYRLPNTTLVGDFESRDAAVAALKAAQSEAAAEIGHQFKMPKWIVAEKNGSQFNSDEISKS
jgi:hypothetical protein